MADVFLHPVSIIQPELSPAKIKLPEVSTEHYRERLSVTGCVRCVFGNN